MKKYICLFFLFLILLCSCNKVDDYKYLIGVSQCSDDLWRETVNNEMLRESAFYPGTEVEIMTVKDNTEQQIKDIQYLIDKGVDLLVISPNESAAITPVVQKAIKRGIPVILLDRKIETQDYTAYIGGDNYQIGYEVGLYTVSYLKGKGNVVEIRGWEGSTADKERHEGFKDAIKKSPEITVVAQRRGNFLKEDAYLQMADILKNNSQIDVVFAMNDPMATGVYEAYKKYSGIQPFIIGVDALPGEGGGIDNIRKGIQGASFIYPTGGDKVINLAMKILTGEPFNKENLLYTAVVDKSNARIIELQTDQLFEHQTKLESMNDLLNKNIAKYTNQRILLYAVILILLLIVVLLIISIKAYKNKNRATKQLQKQNKEITKQSEILVNQKEQLIKLSTQLEEATNAKLVFFTNISHEFRTPLSLILGPVETLLSSESTTQDQRILLDLIKRNSNRLLNLVSQIIEFRSFENDKMLVYLSYSDLNAFLEELNTVFVDYAKRKQLSFVYKSDNFDSTIWFDKEKVEKIYFNLLSNAFKYADSSIKVSLTKVVEDNVLYVQLSVFNTGSTIPKEQINSIFERFYKVNPHDSGTGIGLALTSTLVNIHKGKIRVESNNKEGTTFTVLLPAQKIEGDYVKVDDNSYEKGYTSNLLGQESSIEISDSFDIIETTDDAIVLLIEDNEDMARFMIHTLKDQYTVIWAQNGEIGIEKALKFIPDIIISDVMMPGKDGFEVCKLLKENMSTSHIPIVLLTACSLDEQKAIGFENGAEAYIPKPFNAELLQIRLRKIIENRQKIRQSFNFSSTINNTNSRTTIGTLEQSFINNFRQYVEANISDTELNVDDIAKELGLSRVQLYRKIKSITNNSPTELIKITRLKYAITLLNNKGKNITEVAYEAGFSSPSYFTKCFKEVYKESPTDYLRRISNVL